VVCLVASLSYSRASLVDISGILALLAHMHGEGQDLPEIDWTKTTHVVADVVLSGVALVAKDEEGCIVGSIGGYVSSHWYSTAGHLGDLWFYVVPGCRKTKAAVQLMEGFREAAKTLQVPLQVGHVFGDQDLERKDKFYRRMGFRPVGSIYVGE